MEEKNLFELWNDKELPEEIQKEVDGFASAKYDSTNAEKIFRAGFIVGLNNNRYKKIMGIEEQGAGYGIKAIKRSGNRNLEAG